MANKNKIMANDSNQIASESVSFFLNEHDFLNFSETTDNLFKTLEDIHEIIQCRTNIFTQKKEKHQQILDYQMMKLDNERKEYIKKSEIIMNEMGSSKTKLMQIEHSYFNLRNKLNLEKQTHQALEERIKQLQLDNKQKDAEFYKTSQLFKVVMNKYEDYLNMSVCLDEEKPKVMKVTFKETKKDFKGYPYVKLEMLGDDKFQILKVHPLMEEDNNTKQIIQCHEITAFLNSFRKHFLESGCRWSVCRE